MTYSKEFKKKILKAYEEIQDRPHLNTSNWYIETELGEFNGVRSLCRAVGISTNTLYRWLKKSQRYTR